MLDLDLEKKKALALLNRKPGANIEIIRPDVRADTEGLEELNKWPKIKIDKGKLTPLERIQEYRRIIEQ